MKFGAFDLHIVSDGSFLLDGGQMFSVVPKVLWEKKIPADARNRIRLGLTCLLIQTGRENILVETGIGDKFDAKFSEIYGVDHSRTLPGRTREAALEPRTSTSSSTPTCISTIAGGMFGARTEAGADFSSRSVFCAARRMGRRASCHGAQSRQLHGAVLCCRAKRKQSFWMATRKSSPACAWKLARGTRGGCNACAWNRKATRRTFPRIWCPRVPICPYPWMTSFDLYPLETLANKKRLLPELAEANALAGLSPMTLAFPGRAW